MKKWDELADEQSIRKTVTALKENGMEAFVVENGKEAKEKALSLIEKGASVMTATSTTTMQTGLDKAIDDSEEFVSLRKKIMALPESEQRTQARRINSSPDYVVGSAHAVTEDGKAVIASNSGSQLAPYTFSATYVIWVIGTQKIVKDLDEGIKRIYEYVLELESGRLMKAYGIPSNVSKLLIVNKEINPERIKIIFVKEKLGF